MARQHGAAADHLIKIKGLGSRLAYKRPVVKRHT